MSKLPDIFRRNGRVTRTLGHPVFWIAIGALFLLAPPDGPVSPWRWTVLPPYALLTLGYLLRPRPPFHLAFPFASLAYIVLVWALGMLFELSLTVDGTGLGGYHPDTFTSFVVAQGDYVALAALTLAAIRWLHLEARAVFFLCLGASLTEGLVFNGVLPAVAVLNPILLPVFIGYYALAYASFLALPLFLIDPASLHAPRPFRRVQPTLAIIAIGFALALAARAALLFFWGPLANALFDLAPPVAAP